LKDIVKTPQGEATMPAIPFQTKTPEIGKGCFIAPDAWVIGDVVFGPQVSAFFGVVARGDIKAIRVGAGTNLQEHALLHTSTGLSDCIVGANVTVGHRAILHGCTVEDSCIIGMGATVLDGAVVGKYSIVGAQSLVPMGMKIPERSLVLGVPAKVVRTISENEVKNINESAEHYRTLGAEYQAQFSKVPR
jgi:carbonic anhydrase/acetyltransferase-like protein (isoleucine patch superfamily)